MQPLPLLMLLFTENVSDLNETLSGCIHFLTYFWGATTGFMLTLILRCFDHLVMSISQS
jgi:hypothetical protein